MDLNRRLSMEEVADLLRENGFPVVGDDVAFLSNHGVVLDFPLSNATGDSTNRSDEPEESPKDDDLTRDSRPESLLYLVGFRPPVLSIVSEPEMYASRIDLRHVGRRSPRSRLLTLIRRKLLRRDRIRRLKVHR